VQVFLTSQRLRRFAAVFCGLSGGRWKPPTRQTTKNYSEPRSGARNNLHTGLNNAMCKFIVPLCGTQCVDVAKVWAGRLPAHTFATSTHLRSATGAEESSKHANRVN